MRRELVIGCTVSRYEQFDISPETIEQDANIYRQTDIQLFHHSSICSDDFSCI